MNLHRWLFSCGLLLLTWIGTAQGAEPMRIVMAVPGPGAASYLPAELITKIGADRAEGAELSLSFVAGGGLALEQMLTNNVDFAMVGLPAAMSARLKDPRIVAIAAVNDLPLYVLMVRQQLKGEVAKVADLKGRTIGVHTNSLASKTNSHQLLDLVLLKNGITPDMVRTVPVGQRWQSESAMLQTGETDAIMGDEPYASRMMDEKIAYPLLHLGNPAQSQTIPGSGFLRGAVIARTDSIANNPKKAEVMVRILKRVLAWMATQSPDEIVRTAGMTGTPESKHFLQVLKKYPRQYSKDGKFSTRQLLETEIFFHASQGANPAAKALKLEPMVSDRWAGRKD